MKSMWLASNVDHIVQAADKHKQDKFVHVMMYSSKMQVKSAHPREGTHACEVLVHRAALWEVDQHAPHEQLEAAVSDGLCKRAEIGNTVISNMKNSLVAKR